MGRSAEVETAGRACSEAQLSGDLPMLIYAATVKPLDLVEGREVMLRLDGLPKKPRSTLLRCPPVSRRPGHRPTV